jgi:hypothetical protein
MKKYILITLLVILVVWLQGCGKKNETNIYFDEFVYTAETESVLNKIENTENLWENLSIQVIYTQEWQSGFMDSIIINKELQNNTITLKKLTDINIQKSAKRLQWFEVDEVDVFGIECNNEIIEAYKYSFLFDSITPKEIIYSNQVFFIYRDNLYSISTATEDKWENKNLEASLKNINCTK